MKPQVWVGRFSAIPILLVIIIVASGCVGLPMACTELQADVKTVQSLPFGQMHRAELRSWAGETFGVDDSAISTSWTADGAMNLSWTLPGWATYVARFGLDGEGPLERLDVYWSQVNLTAARTVECLGAPGAYEAYAPARAPGSLVVQLWYPDHNVGVQSLGVTRTSPDGTVLVDGSLVMTGLVAKLAAPAGPVTSTQALMRSWPGNWPGMQAVDRVP